MTRRLSRLTVGGLGNPGAYTGRTARRPGRRGALLVKILRLLGSVIVHWHMSRLDPAYRNNFDPSSGNVDFKILVVAVGDSEWPFVGRCQWWVDSTSADEDMCCSPEISRHVYSRFSVRGCGLRL